MATRLPSFLDYMRTLNSSAEIEIDLSKPLKLYFRSTEMVFKQAAIYFGEADLEKSYILFMKFCNLVLDKLPKHTEYGRAEFSLQKSKLKELCRKSIDKLENIRPRLEKLYSELVEAERIAALEIERLQEREIVKKEETDRLQKLKSEQEKLNLSSAKSSPEINMNPNISQDALIAPMAASVSGYNLSSANVPESRYKETNDTLKSFQDRMGMPYVPQIQLSHVSVNPTVETLPKYFSENGEPLRPVHIPQGLIASFLQLAANNTRSNLETCGVLSGKLHHDEFTITCLIIPKQVATSDTCAMINEEEIITAQDSLDVMSLGWIHTHPTQKCFLSSVDLHTHMPFQLLMAEAIAIVCAPTQNPNFGIFRLTDPPGLDLITNCQHPSAFHPHPENVMIYRELKGPESHAQINPNLALEVIDLRK